MNFDALSREILTCAGVIFHAGRIKNRPLLQGETAGNKCTDVSAQVSQMPGYPVGLLVRGGVLPVAPGLFVRDSS